MNTLGELFRGIGAESFKTSPVSAFSRDASLFLQRTRKLVLVLLYLIYLSIVSFLETSLPGFSPQVDVTL